MHKKLKSSLTVVFNSLKECIDDRVTDPNHDGFSRSFEEFVSGVPEAVMTKRIRIWHDHTDFLVVSQIQVLDEDGINQ